MSHIRLWRRDDCSMVVCDCSRASSGGAALLLNACRNTRFVGAVAGRKWWRGQADRCRCGGIVDDERQIVGCGCHGGNGLAGSRFGRRCCQPCTSNSADAHPTTRAAMTVILLRDPLRAGCVTNQASYSDFTHFRRSCQVRLDETYSAECSMSRGLRTPNAPRLATCV